MKRIQAITLFCLLMLPLVAIAQGNKVTINVQQQALTNALRQVEQQSGYFKVNYPGHNLVRTRCQLALAKDILRKKEELKWIVEETLENG